MECKALRDSAEALSNFRVKIFVISCDSIEKTQAFAEKLGMPFPILSDPDRKAARIFGVDRLMGLSKRHTFYFGPEGKLRVIDKKVDVSTHGAAVLSTLKQQKFPTK